MHARDAFYELYIVVYGAFEDNNEWASNTRLASNMEMYSINGLSVTINSCAARTRLLSHE